MKVVTYATHDFGTFQEIINNEFGVPVKVLGWGTKWNGFMDKIKAVREYCETLPDDELVIFVDGFDSRIMKPLDDLEKNFNEYNCQVLISRNPSLAGEYVNNKIFGTCKDDVTANSGLYMGRNSYLKAFLTSALEQKTSDDQTNFNSSCQYFSWVQVDTENKIFFNKPPMYSGEIPEGIYFFSEPGKISPSRVYRSIFEYAPFLKVEIFLCVILILVIWYLWSA